ncbi:MAG: hypothetical protein AAGF98_14615, partial [Cyanobacteria bacterium P01_H01_bin.153]
YPTEPAGLIFHSYLVLPKKYGLTATCKESLLILNNLNQNLCNLFTVTEPFFSSISLDRCCWASASGLQQNAECRVQNAECRVQERLGGGGLPCQPALRGKSRVFA